MNVREKLVELLNEAFFDYNHGKGDGYIPKNFADHLIANGVTVQEWISVEDRLPEETINCIVHYQHAYCDNDDYWAIGFCCYDGEKFQLGPAYKVTHWMPLPSTEGLK